MDTYTSKAHSDAIAEVVRTARYCRGNDAIECIKSAIAHPGVFVFGELYDLGGIQELRHSEEHKVYFDLLEIFAFGTWTDFVHMRTIGSIPKLSEEEIWKLKQLSLVSIASGEDKTIPYGLAVDTLDLETEQAVEDLVLSCCGSGLLLASLDHAKKLIHISRCMGRDVKDEAEVSKMKALLDAWLDNIERCHNLLDTPVTREQNTIVTTVVQLQMITEEEK